MPDNQLLILKPKPGIQRDGTVYDADACTDGQWVRWQRGMPRKIGGYRRVTDQLQGPIRKNLVWSRADLNAIFTFSSSKIEMVLVDNGGLGSGIVDRTPAGFTPNADHTWSVDTQYDDAVGTTGTIVLAHAGHALRNIDDQTTDQIYSGLATGSGAFTLLTDSPSVSGGVFSLAPYTVAYGSDGFVSWSDANQPQVWSTSAGNIGDAGADRITGSKIVKGIALRAGTGVAGILWSLDSVLRMDYIGGGAVFRFSTISTQSSVLSQNSIIEYDGMFFWIGVDRFLYYDSAVRELPNDVNQNYFFDNLNYDQRQKVHATKVPRFGEIWWFYPSGDNTECDRAVIFNVREKAWYDIELARSSGFYSQVLHFPMWGANDASTVIAIPALTDFVVGDVVAGAASSATGNLAVLDATYNTVTLTDVVGEFIIGETVTSTSGGSQVNTFIDTYSSGKMYQHEFGLDAVEGDNQLAIDSYFMSHDFGLANQGTNFWTRLTRVEPDFNQVGDIEVTIHGQEFANSPHDSETSYNLPADTPLLDMREQHRHIQIEFRSNTVGGFYEMGNTMLHIEQGDSRS